MEESRHSLGRSLEVNWAELAVERNWITHVGEVLSRDEDLGTTSFRSRVGPNSIDDGLFVVGESNACIDKVHTIK